jgi:hypothetical protein
VLASRRLRLGATVFAVAIGSLVSVVRGSRRAHEPTFYAINLAGFSGGTTAMSRAAAGVSVLVVVQMASALVPFGRVPGLTGTTAGGACWRCVGAEHHRGG